MKGKKKNTSCSIPLISIICFLQIILFDESMEFLVCAFFNKRPGNITATKESLRLILSFYPNRIIYMN